MPQPTIVPLAPDATAHMDVGQLGQLPGLDVYTQLTYVFAGGDDRRAETVARIEAGLARLGAAFPWLAGAVAHDDTRQRFCFVPRPGAAAPELVVTDLTRDAEPALTLDTLAAASYPCRLLHESILAPVGTLPGGGGGRAHETAREAARPVLAVQAVFVAGGLLLTVAAHHRAMDMGSMAAVIQQLAAACRSRSAICDDAQALGNCARGPLLPLLTADEIGATDPLALIPEQVTGGGGDNDDTVSKPHDNQTHENPDPVWSYFVFSAASLAALKAAAAASRPADAPAPFVSTNDACTACLWQAVVRARLPRLAPDTDRPSTLARAVDVRRALGLPDGAPGMLQTMTLHTRPAAWVAAAPLGAVAVLLRAALLDPADLALRTRALATVTARDPAGTAQPLAFTGRAGADSAGASMMLSSWTDVPADAARNFDLGLGLGAPRAVRRPAFLPLEGLLYLLPRAADGSVTAMLCLRAADLARLRADAAFAQHAQYVG